LKLLTCRKFKFLATIEVQMKNGLPKEAKV